MRYAIVGNAPTRIDRSEAIDSADRVVRFNNAFGFGQVNGSAVHELWLINTGGQMREWLDTPAFWQAPARLQAQAVVLPIHPGVVDLFETHDASNPDAINHAEEAEDRLRELHQRVEVIPATAFAVACRTLGLKRLREGDAVPSTGFLALHTLHARYPEATFDVFGFSFEGWPCHPWTAERAWVIEQDRVRWHSDS